MKEKENVINDMILDFEDGFRLVYAEKCSSPKNKFILDKSDVISFVKDNIDTFALLVINSSIIDCEKLKIKINNGDI